MLESTINKLTILANEGAEERSIANIEDILADGIEDAVKSPLFYNLPIKNICNIINVGQNIECTSQIIHELSISRPDEAPLILNNIDIKDCCLDDYIMIISSLSCSQFCSSLSSAYKENETLPAIEKELKIDELKKEIIEIKEKEQEQEQIIICDLDQEEEPNSYEHDIFKAIEENKLQSVRYNIEKDQTPVDTKTKNNITPLLLASSCGHLQIVKYLIENCNASVNDKDVYGNNCLHLAAKSGSVELVSYLINQQGVDVESRNNVLWTPLIVAANCGDLNIVKYLIEKCNADYDATDGEYTALHIAILGGFTEIVEYLSVFARKITSDMIELTDDNKIKQILKNKKNLLKSRN